MSDTLDKWEAEASVYKNWEHKMQEGDPELVGYQRILALIELVRAKDEALKKILNDSVPSGGGTDFSRGVSLVNSIHREVATNALALTEHLK